MMGRILEEGETAGAGQRARTVEAVAGDQLVKICNLCYEEVTEDCKGGNCESCCESNRGIGPFQCCAGGFKLSDDESAAEGLVVPSQDSSPPALALQGSQATGHSGRGRGQQMAPQMTVQ